MKYLLDTHAFLWFVRGDQALSTESQELIANPNSLIYPSVASIWEMAIKASREKLAVPSPFHTFVAGELADNDFALLSISIEHGEIVASLPFPKSGHRDPFDRLIVAQSLCENLPVITKDPAFDNYPIQRVW